MDQFPENRSERGQSKVELLVTHTDLADGVTGLILWCQLTDLVPQYPIFISNHKAAI